MNMRWTLVLLPALLSLGLGNPVQPEETITTQEGFELPKLFGKWYDIAVATTCKYMQHHKSNFNMGTMELSEGETGGDVQSVSTRMRHGTCAQKSRSYQKTDVPGKFIHADPSKGAEMENYVVYTNYEEYAIMIVRRIWGTGKTATVLKLYGRTPEVRQSLVEEFKQFALERGIPQDAIFLLTNKGECEPGEIEVTRTRVQRAVLPEEEEGSGMANTPVSKNKGESCLLSAEAGPCHGMYTRYFYNSSSMACETFRYGGCLGNNNNFHSEKQCLQTCRTEAACRLPIVSGPCKMAKSLWAFDPAEGKCVPFQYGGCKGNGNQFYTEKECKEYCGVPGEGDEEFLD
ncbi:protein AMBP [Spea bombifrons]|uniref:protein AMBP n=1 Tax=Spea bombifrons TaxID=233779 RepID=UPI002349EBB0|nr:protein AMBP [Spea bombifrons]